MDLTYHVEENIATGEFVAYCPYMKPVRIFIKNKEDIESRINDAVELYLQRHPEFRNELYTIDILPIVRA